MVFRILGVVKNEKSWAFSYRYACNRWYTKWIRYNLSISNNLSDKSITPSFGNVLPIKKLFRQLIFVDWFWYNYKLFNSFFSRGWCVIFFFFYRAMQRCYLRKISRETISASSRGFRWSICRGQSNSLYKGLDIWRRRTRWVNNGLEKPPFYAYIQFLFSSRKSWEVDDSSKVIG